jgi:hypothetical protein
VLKQNSLRLQLAFAFLCTALLGAAGAPPPYDMAATPDATIIRQHALNRCRAAPTTTMRAQIDCSLAAHRLFAVGEHLRDMQLFRDYATALRQAADDSDAKRISPYEAQSRIVRAGVKFRASVEAEYQDWRHSQGLPPKGPLIDRAAYPAALKARDAAVARCGAWTSVAAIPAVTKCVRKAERGFADAIHLADMDLYYGYDSVLTFTAADAQDGQVTPANLTLRHQQIWADFLQTIQK